MELKIRLIVQDKDRVLLYDENHDYHVITNHDTANFLKLRIGDVVQFEPYGMNFGFLDEEWARDAAKALEG